MSRKRRNKFIETLDCKHFSRGRYRSIRIFPVLKSVRSEVVSYFEGFPQNLSNTGFVTSIIFALITALHMFAFCGIHPPRFLSECLYKKDLVFAPASLQPSRFQLVSAKDLPCVLTVRGVGRFGWQEGGKVVSVQRQAASRLMTLKYPTSCPINVQCHPVHC